MIKLRASDPQAGLNIPKAFAIGQLRERQAKELIEARKTLNFVTALVTAHAFAELVQGQVVHQLRKNGPSSHH
jgi:hypothetical protein